jgi:Glycosyl transferase family 2.
MVKNDNNNIIKLVFGPGIGKGAACRAGFAKAENDIFIILDADMTVMPESLPSFIDALLEKRGDFINGSRLVYPIEGEAMRFLNILGNKMFAILFSFLLSQPIKDTLCGTKAIWKKDYGKILEGRKYFGSVDIWGDYDWIFGANRHNLKIIEMPVHYRKRVAGETKMNHRFTNAWIMLKMCRIAFWKTKVL